MNAYLMHRDRDFDTMGSLPWQSTDLMQDLELTTLINAMANGDKYLWSVCQRVLLLSLTKPEEIAYRQDVLTDCLTLPAVVRELYGVAIEALESERKVLFGFLLNSPHIVLQRSAEIMALLLGVMRKLRRIADVHAVEFQSEGFQRFFAMIAAELNDDYLRTVDHHLHELRFGHGVLISARLTKGNKGTGYTVREQHEPSWLERLAFAEEPGLSFRIPDRDESGFKALENLRDRGINQIANVVAQATDHVLGFFGMVRAVLAFYIGCLNLAERLATRGAATCLPEPITADTVALTARGLYDLPLTLTTEEAVVSNDLDADGKSLVMVTGANQGGKSTFLRSVGVAQLMMQAGMYVPASSFRSNVCASVFTHFKREEDVTMQRGKLDEELHRMSEIADRIAPTSLLLCNESFASTNEREGSEIARQIVRALTEAGVKVVFVTHLFDLANGFYRQGLDAALFLRAERHPDGGRTFRIVPGEPLPTSYGVDSYQRIFGVKAPSK